MALHGSEQTFEALRATVSGRGKGKIEGRLAASLPKISVHHGQSWQSHEQKLKCKSARTATRADKTI